MDVLPTTLIETATRPLVADAELRQGAVKALQDLLDSSPAAGAKAKEAIARWNDLDARPRPLASWKWVLASLLALASVLTVLKNYREIVFYYQVTQASIFDWSKVETLSREYLAARRWSPEEKLLLFGDTSRSGVTEQRKALWDYQPGNPAYYLDYVSHYHSGKRTVPPDFLEIMARIDPDNAMPLYFAASVLAQESVAKPRLNSADKKAGKIQEWRIKDEAKLEQALSLARSASSKPKFTSYANKVMRERLALLPQESRIDSLISGTVIFGNPSMTIGLWKLAFAFSAKAHLCAVNGDRDGFRELLRSMETFYRFQLDAEEATLLDRLLIESEALESYPAFYAAAVTLDLPDEALRLREISDRLKARREAKMHRAAMAQALEEKDSLSLEGNLDFGSLHLISRQVASPPQIRRSDWFPITFSDHALFSWVWAICLSILLGLTVGVLALNRFVTSRLVQLLAERLESVLRPVDHAIIVGIGCGLPILYILAISRLTPFGGHEWGVSGMVMRLVIDHALALFLMIPGLSILAARWRLEKRLPGFRCRGKAWPGRIVVFLAVIEVPWVGWGIVRESLGNSGLITGAAMLVPLFLWLLVSLVRGPFGDIRQRLASSVMARTVTPVFGIAMLCMLALIPVFKAEEFYWYRRASLLRFSAETAPMVKHEYDITMQLQQELKAALGF